MNIETQPTGKAQNQKSVPKKEWYKNWWGVIIALLFLPLFAIWYIWEKTGWSNKKRGWATAAVIVLSLFIYSDSPEKPSSQQSENTPEPVQVTETAPTTPDQPAPTPTPTSQPEATPAPIAPEEKASFDDGMHIVGEDIQAGTYRTREASGGCYFARLKGFSGELDDILSNENTSYPSVITIKSTDKGFQTKNCGKWTLDLSAITTDTTHISDGVYIVGTDLVAGTYKSSGDSGSCYYARLNGFTGDLSEVIANGNSDTATIVTIASRDKGFKSSGCGSWEKIK